MKIAVLGLGFVGTTSLIGFDYLGFEVYGVESNKVRLDNFKKGKIPFKDQILEKRFLTCNSTVFLDSVKALPTDCGDILVCVETPTTGKSLDLSVVKVAISQICADICNRNIWLRSTLDTPDIFKELRALLEKSQNNLYFFPEFMREGECWQDFLDPAFTILAGNEVENTNFYKKLYRINKYKIHTCSIAEAITVKIASNAFHALKVVFANELKYLKFINEIRLDKVMEIFCSDDKLNISSKYLLPGEPYSGPCLKKDTLALSSAINSSLSSYSMISQIDRSNERQLELIIHKIESMDENNIGFWGIEFKKMSGDIRNSHIVKIVNSIQNKNIFIFEDNVSNEDLNEYLNQNVRILRNIDDLLESSEVVISDNNYNTNLCKFIPLQGL
jgi:GDP-mannose 6-dehydrogenase